MAKIFRNKALDDYFAELDCSDLERVDGALATRLYETGKATLLTGYRVDYDADFLASLEFPNEPKQLKKFGSHHFLAEAHGDTVKRVGSADGQRLSDAVLDRVFLGDRARFGYFREQVEHVNAQILRLTETLFPSYRRRNESITWRFSETINENMHVDVYKEDLPHHHLRMFVNVDNVPRLWNVSWSLDHMLQDHLGELDAEFVRSATPGRICHDLNFAVFGRMGDAGMDGQPRHICYFEPGEVWFVDSRRISHQIVYGRRAISTDFAIEIDSMADPDQHYYAIVERHRRNYAAT